MSRDLLDLERTRHLVPGARRGSVRSRADERGVEGSGEESDSVDADAGTSRPAPTRTTPRATSGAPHWPALDGLRGLAVAGVVAYHLGWISGGFLGVDLFFALSGFLITTLLVREHRASGRIDLPTFWGRRFRRLLPAVMAVIVAVIVWTAAFGSPAEQAGARGDARWAIPYLANWHFVSAARDYWASATESSVFTHLWSLAIEEQFYVVWPVVAWWALRGRSGESRLAAVTCIGIVASGLAMVLWYDASSPSRVYLGTDTRASALLIGAFMALAPAQRMVRSVRRRPSIHSNRWVGLLLALLMASWLVGGDHLDLLLRGGLLVHSFLAALLVGLLATSTEHSTGLGIDRPRWRLPRLDDGWVTWLGRRSYGIYLWHWPVIVLAQPRWDGLAAPVRDLTIIVVSLALAEASYRLLEEPVRRRRGWARGRRSTWATIGITVLATVVVIVAPSGRGHVAGFDVGSVGLSPPLAIADDPSATPVAGASPLTEPGTGDRSGDVGASAGSAGAGAGVDASTMGPADIEDVEDIDAGGAADVGSAVVAGSSTNDAAQAVAPPTPPRHRMSTVLWVGDSVAADLAPALTAAFGAAGVAWIDGAGDGLRLTPGGGVDPVAVYTDLFAEHSFDTVVVQLSYWDNPADLDQLRRSLGWFRDQVRVRDADLVVVTPPPVRADLVDPGLARQIEVAHELVADGEGRVHLVDSVGAWGATMSVDIDLDGAPDRKPDGVHVCPQGAARFASWLVSELSARFDGVTAQPIGAWGTGGWSASERYDTPTGACAALD